MGGGERDSQSPMADSQLGAKAGVGGELEAAYGGEDALEQGVGIGGTARDIDIHGDDFVHAAEAGVVLAEDAAAATAGAHGHDQARVGRRFVGLAQGQFHVARDGPGDEQHVGVAR